MTKSYNILFLCTHNSARSIMAEAVATMQTHGILTGYSAGSSPSGAINPFARELALNMGYPAEKLRSKNWDEFARPDAPKMDFIITVCDNAAGEECPVWIGNPVTAHWGFPDPSLVQGTDEVKRKAFLDVMLGLRQRIELLAALPLDQLDHLSLHVKLKELAQL